MQAKRIGVKHTRRSFFLEFDDGKLVEVEHLDEVQKGVLEPVLIFWMFGCDAGGIILRRDVAD